MSPMPYISKALLFANVGTDKFGFYHVGDEAMFLETFNLYRKHFPDIKLSALSSKPFRNNPNLTETIGLQWPENLSQARSYFLKLVVKAWILKMFGISLFHAPQREFIDFIISHDFIHYTGGGNIASECKHWLYYALLVMSIGRIFDKPVFLSSQTIGPFSMLDQLAASYSLNKVQTITLRQSNKKLIRTLRKMGVKKPKIYNAPDACYFMNHVTSSKLIVPRKNHRIRIGLSIHERENTGPYMKDFITAALTELSYIYPGIEILILPHIFDRKNGWDLHYMQELTKLLPFNMRVITLSHSLLTKNGEPAEIIHKLTRSCDIMLASRYHGLVFALSQNIPAVSIVNGTYQQVKNKGVLNFVFKNETNKFIFNLPSSNSSDLCTKLLHVIQRRKSLKKIIERNNTKIMRMDQLEKKRILAYITKYSST